MFITFEGLDGSGKTTQIQKITAYLRTQGYDALLTREPGGSDIGDQIRDILLTKSSNRMHPHTELLLFCASRAQLVEEVIRPHLKHQGIVLCDRYIDSTLAYQGYGHGLDITRLQSILDFATGGLHPDLTLYFDLTPEEAVRRKFQGSLFGEEWNRLDDVQFSFRQRVYDGYRSLISAEPERFVIIDAAQSIDRMFEEVCLALESRLGVR